MVIMASGCEYVIVTPQEYQELKERAEQAELIKTKYKNSEGMRLTCEQRIAELERDISVYSSPFSIPLNGIEKGRLDSLEKITVQQQEEIKKLKKQIECGVTVEGKNAAYWYNEYKNLERERTKLSIKIEGYNITDWRDMYNSLEMSYERQQIINKNLAEAANKEKERADRIEAANKNLAVAVSHEKERADEIKERYERLCITNQEKARTLATIRDAINRA